MDVRIFDFFRMPQRTKSFRAGKKIWIIQRRGNFCDCVGKRWGRYVHRKVDLRFMSHTSIRQAQVSERFHNKMQKVCYGS